MKIQIRYRKTGKVEEQEILSAFFTDGKLVLVLKNGFSCFYPQDDVEIDILPK